MLERGVEQADGAEDIGLDKGGRAVDRAIDMRLNGKMHHASIRSCASTEVELRSIAPNIGADEAEIGLAGHHLQRAILPA